MTPQPDFDLALDALELPLQTLNGLARLLETLLEAAEPSEREIDHAQTVAMLLLEKTAEAIERYNAACNALYVERRAAAACLQSRQSHLQAEERQRAAG